MTTDTEEEQKEWLDRGQSRGGNRVGITCCNLKCIPDAESRKFTCSICDFTISLQKLMDIHGLLLAYNLLDTIDASKEGEECDWRV